MKLQHHAATVQGGTLTMTLHITVNGLADAAAAEARILTACNFMLATPQPGVVYPEGMVKPPTAVRFTPSGTGTVIQPEPERPALVIDRGMGKIIPTPKAPTTLPQRVTDIAPFSHKRWTNDDDDMFIIEHYGQMKTKKIAAKLGRSEQAINARAGWLRSQGYPIPMLKPQVSAGIRALNERRKAEKAQPEPEPSPFDMTPAFPELMGTN